VAVKHRVLLGRACGKNAYFVLLSFGNLKILGGLVGRLTALLQQRGWPSTGRDLCRIVNYNVFLTTTVSARWLCWIVGNYFLSWFQTFDKILP